MSMFDTGLGGMLDSNPGGMGFGGSGIDWSNPADIAAPSDYTNTSFDMYSVPNSPNGELDSVLTNMYSGQDQSLNPVNTFTEYGLSGNSIPGISANSGVVTPTVSGGGTSWLNSLSSLMGSIGSGLGAMSGTGVNATKPVGTSTNTAGIQQPTNKIPISNAPATGLSSLLSGSNGMLLIGGAALLAFLLLRK